MRCGETIPFEQQTKDRIDMAQKRWQANVMYYVELKQQNPDDPFYAHVTAELKRVLAYTYTRSREKCKNLPELYDLVLRVDRLIRDYLYEMWQDRARNMPQTFLTLEEMSAWRK